MPQGPLVTAMLVRYASGYTEVDSGGTVINTTTGRPAFTGPNGEPGIAYPPIAPNTTAYQMPDGRVAYYAVGATPNPGNVQGLANWNREHAYGRLEGFLSLGSTQAKADAQAIAQRVVDGRSVPSVTVTAQVEPAGVSDTPYEGFWVGDTVTCPDEKGNSLRVRVASMTVAETDMGDPIFTPELLLPATQSDLALQRWLKRMSNGTIGGIVQSASPAPSSAPILPGSPVAGQTQEWVFDFPGPVIIGVTDGVRPRVSGATSGATITATIAPSAAASYDILKNGAVAGTITLAAAATENSLTFSVPYTTTDILQARATTPGGASGVVIQLRGS